MGRNSELERLYYTPSLPSAFGGRAKLKRGFKGHVKNWITYQDAYTLHKKVTRRFPRRQIIVSGIDAQWQADLVDVKNLKKHNENHSYLLTCIDVFSKYAWVVPLTDKKGTTLVSAFDSIVTRGRKPERLQTDKGTEFTNRQFQKYLKDNQIHFFVTENEDIKASIIERFNRTLKEKIWRYFTYKNTLTYLDVLPDLVTAYNTTYHRSLGRAPADVDRENQETVWQTLYGRPITPKRAKLLVGDKVRISKARRTFKKGYLPSWTEELFEVSHVNSTRPPTYRIKDLAGETVKGAFYEQELQKVGEPEAYRIEAVLDTRTLPRGRRQYLVKWWGYPASFNSWVEEGDLVTP